MRIYYRTASRRSSCSSTDAPRLLLLLPPLHARRSLDQKWQEAMTELNEQIHLEDHTLDLPEGHPGSEVRPTEPSASVLPCDVTGVR